MYFRGYLGFTLGFYNSKNSVLQKMHSFTIITSITRITKVTKVTIVSTIVHINAQKDTF